ncbi:MAG TPA: helix-turn-helix transcriptional regulator [Acidimicrobiales bacterium]|nr:helix-turn-helix transcriptional regulator [Acidimicrobiales bacterium]
MTEETTGQRIARRRKALGLDVIDLANRAGVDRGNLARIEADEVQRPRQSTLHAIETALDRLEEEMSGPYDTPPQPRVVTFRVHGNFGVDVVVEGPVENLKDLQNSVKELLADMRSERADERDQPAKPGSGDE